MSLNEIHFDELTSEEKKKFVKLLVQADFALDVFQETGNRLGFVALQDQIETFESEIETRKKNSNEHEQVTDN